MTELFNILTGQYGDTTLFIGSVHQLISDHRGRNGHWKADAVSEHISDFTLHCNLRPQTYTL